MWGHAGLDVRSDLASQSRSIDHRWHFAHVAWRVTLLHVAIGLHIFMPLLFTEARFNHVTGDMTI